MRTWVNCKNCGEKYSSELKKCPFCNTRPPLSWWKKCVVIFTIVLLAVVGGGGAFRFIEKVYKITPNEEPTHSSVESNDSDDFMQDDPDTDNNDVKQEAEIDLNDNKTSTPKVENDEPKSQEQKVENETLQDKVTGVKTADIVLPDFFDATEGLYSCKEYAPLSYVVLLSCMRKAVSGYNSQFDGDYLLEVGGNTDRIMLYTYRMRFDFADVNGTKEKCEKYLDDNTNFIKSQLALYKKTMPEIAGIMVIFEHDESNLTLTSRIFR